MKKVVILLLMVFLIGCSKKISYYEIELDNSEWKYSNMNQDVIKIVSTNCFEDKCKFKIEPIKKGKSVITFLKIMGKEQLGAIYEITIDSDLKISEKHYGSYFESVK